MIAAANNRTECLQVLATQERVDWNIQDNDGETAAICAVANDSVEAVRFLLTVPQLNWNLRTNDDDDDDDDDEHFKPNSSAVTIALEEGNKEIIDLLLSAFGLQLNVDYLVNKLEDMYREECPVCLEVFTSSMKIQQCTRGHFTCEPCRNKIEWCSECRGPFVGRALGYERTLRNNDYNKQQCSEDVWMAYSILSKRIN